MMPFEAVFDTEADLFVIESFDTEDGAFDEEGDTNNAEDGGLRLVPLYPAEVPPFMWKV